MGGEVAIMTSVLIEHRAPFLGHPCIHLHQPDHAVALGLHAAPEAISLHDGLAVGLVGATPLHGYADFIVKVGQRAIWVDVPSSSPC